MKHWHGIGNIGGRGARNRQKKGMVGGITVLISVIMPVYNAKHYVARAIESVLRQTLRDFELILVDDGSTDGSSAICEKYAGQDVRVRLIRQTNQGLCAARNRGVELAQAEYVAFIDHDDIYLTDLLEENYELAQQHNADMLKYGYQCITEKQFSPDRIRFSSALHGVWSITHTSELAKQYKQLRDRDRLTYVWDGIFKTALLRKTQIAFDTVFKRGHEDIVFCMQVYQHSTCVVINPKIYYVHIMYKVSTSTVFSLERINDTGRLMDYERQLFDSLRLDDLYSGYWQERVMVYILWICNVIRNPAAQISGEEICCILGAFRKKYSCSGSIQLENIDNQRKLKNKLYVYLFKNDHLKILAECLLADRKIKRMIKGIGKFNQYSTRE